MDIAVSGHQVDLSESFQAHATEGLEAVAERYFSRAIRATVTLGRGPRAQGFTCEIVMHVMHDVILKAGGAAATAQVAFDGAAAKIDKQLRRYVRRLKDRHGSMNGAAAEQAAPAYDAHYTVFEPPVADNDEDDAALNGHAPVVVAERAVDIPTASVADAVMMLDLRNTTALMFRNAGSGTFNMVYRRDDGSIGWVEPERQR